MNGNEVQVSALLFKQQKEERQDKYGCTDS